MKYNSWAKYVNWFDYDEDVCRAFLTKKNNYFSGTDNSIAITCNVKLGLSVFNYMKTLILLFRVQVFFNKTLTSKRIIKGLERDTFENG